jgi:hypothetical protein
MPALAYNTFELYNGLGEKGGIIDYRLYYGMLQTISRRDQFPEDFGFNMRNYMLTRLKEMNKMVKDAEEEIPDHYWIKTTQFVKDNIDHFSKRVRLSLQDNDINNATALKLFWKIRCRLDPSRGECKESPDQKIKRDKQIAEKKREEEKLALEKKKREQERLEQQRLEQEKQAQEQRKLEEERLALERERMQLEKFEQAQTKPKTEVIPEEVELRIQEEKIALEKAKLEEARLKLEKEKLALAYEKQELQEKNRSIWDILFGWMWNWN